MSWPGGNPQPQQAKLAQALHHFGYAMDHAVRAWAGQLTMRQRSTSHTSPRTSWTFSKPRLNGSAVTGWEVCQHRTMSPGQISRTRR